MVARPTAGINSELGVLDSGDSPEAERADLVAAHVVQTALKMIEAFKQALGGGVLFTDEGSALHRDHGQDFGQELIDTLRLLLGHHLEEAAVPDAGGPELIENFVNSNSGLRSRADKRNLLCAYSDEVLAGVFEARCCVRGDEHIQDALWRLSAALGATLRTASFSNGQATRELFGQTRGNQADLAGNQRAASTELQSLDSLDAPTFSI